LQIENVFFAAHAERGVLLRRDILAVLNQPRYRQASQRVAADMAAAPGFVGLANLVDRLIAGPTPLTADSSSSNSHEV
jgi:UDP:flavonoid glycosyltransferase YjiC (YdhE family)